MPPSPSPRVRLALTGHGLAYLISAATLLAVAVIYNNNPCFLLAFAAFAVLAATAPATLFHARGLRVLGVRCEPVFAGDRAAWSLAVRMDRGRGADVGLELGGGHTVRELRRGRTARLEVLLDATRRGLLHPGQATVMTEYPLGLFRAGFSVPVPPCLVYPRPQAGPAATLPAHGAGQRPRPSGSGAEDFRDLAVWRPGDPPSRIAWKASVRGQGMRTKVFDDLADQAPVFDWFALAGDAEGRLSRLCHMVLEASRAGLAYGLRLPETRLDTARGPEHRHRALRALALFGAPEGGRD